MLANSHSVKLSQDKDGNVICTPHKLVASKGQNIEWASETGQPFTVDFNWESPFNEMAYHAGAGEKVSVPIPDLAPDGYFTYFVAMYDKGRGKIFTLDPDLIIRGRK